MMNVSQNRALKNQVGFLLYPPETQNCSQWLEKSPCPKLVKHPVSSAVMRAWKSVTTPCISKGFAQAYMSKEPLPQLQREAGEVKAVTETALTMCTALQVKEDVSHPEKQSVWISWRSVWDAQELQNMCERGDDNGGAHQQLPRKSRFRLVKFGKIQMWRESTKPSLRGGKERNVLWWASFIKSFLLMWGHPGLENVT